MTATGTPIPPSVDPGRTAILVVDVQPFLTDQKLVPPADEVLPRLRTFLDAARTAGVLRVFWTRPGWRARDIDRKGA